MLKSLSSSLICYIRLFRDARMPRILRLCMARRRLDCSVSSPSSSRVLCVGNRTRPRRERLKSSVALLVLRPSPVMVKHLTSTPSGCNVCPRPLGLVSNQCSSRILYAGEFYCLFLPKCYAISYVGSRLDQRHRSRCERNPLNDRRLIRTIITLFSVRGNFAVLLLLDHSYSIVFLLHLPCATIAQPSCQTVRSIPVNLLLR